MIQKGNEETIYGLNHLVQLLTHTVTIKTIHNIGKIKKDCSWKDKTAESNALIF